MCLFVNQAVYASSGGTFVAARDGTARVVRSGRIVDEFDLQTPIQWLNVSPNGGAVLLQTDRASRVWRWRDGFGVEALIEASNSRDLLGFGFAMVNGAVVTLVSKDRTLRGLAADGRELFAGNLGSPHSFAPRSFSQLPGNRLALMGAFFSDPCDVVVTVGFQALLDDPNAVQKAIRSHMPVRDRAIDIAVGPCEPGAAVVLRDPEDEEVADEDDEDEDEEHKNDVGGFVGVYIRELDSGTLLERYEYTGQAGSGAPISATRDWIAVQVIGGVDMIRRTTGEVRHVPAAILDVYGSQLVTVEDNQVASVMSIDSID